MHSKSILAGKPAGAEAAPWTTSGGTTRSPPRVQSIARLGMQVAHYYAQPAPEPQDECSIHYTCFARQTSQRLYCQLPRSRAQSATADWPSSLRDVRPQAGLPPVTPRARHLGYNPITDGPSMQVAHYYARADRDAFQIPILSAYV